MMTTGLALVGMTAVLKVAAATSSGVKLRPSAGAVPATAKKSAVTCARDHDLGLALDAERAAHRVVSGDGR